MKLEEITLKVGDYVDFIGFFEGKPAQKITKIENVIVNNSPLMVYYLSVGFGDNIKFLPKTSLKLWEPKDGDWVVPNFKNCENTITIHKVKEVISYKNLRKNVVICYDGTTYSMDQMCPFYFSL